MGRGNTAYTLAQPIAAPARASPDPGEDINSTLRGGSALVAIVISIVWHEPAMGRRTSSAVRWRGGRVASGPGLPVQRHVQFAPRQLEGAGARNAAPRAAKTAVAVVKPEL